MSGIARDEEVRNIVRFPADFMFQLTKDEWRELITICDNPAKKQDGQDKNIELIFEYMDRLQEKAEQPVQERKAIGFKVGNKNGE